MLKPHNIDNNFRLINKATLNDFGLTYDLRDSIENQLDLASNSRHLYWKLRNELLSVICNVVRVGQVSVAEKY
jgi:hypothetical protein